METPGQRLRWFRKQAKVRQGVIAGEIGVSTPTISRWENDSATLPKMAAMALQVSYNLRWEWLMTGEEPMWVEGATPSLQGIEVISDGLHDLADKLASAGRRLRVAAKQLRGEK